MIYQHYKGGLYRKLFDGVHSSDRSEVVVYVSLKYGTVWVRPKMEFEGKVSVEGHPEPIPRFRFVEDAPRFETKA